MKFLLSLFLAFASVSALAQAPAPVSDVPFKKANAVLIVTPDSAASALKKLGAILVQKGYYIQKLDTDFNTIMTEPRAVKSIFPSSIVVRGRAIPSGLALSAEMTVDTRALKGGAQSTGRVRSTGKDGKGYFLWLDEIAKAYPGAKVQYTTD